MRHRLAIIGAGMLLAGTASATADTLDVCPDGCTYLNIQDAINAAADGDRIEIGPGTYYESLIIDGKAIELIGIAGRDATFIDGNDNVRPLLIEGGIAGINSIEGLTIQKGRRTVSGDGSTVLGGGVSALSTVHIVDSAVIKCYLQATGNGAYAKGGGIYCSGGNNVISNVIIQANYAYGQSGTSGTGICIETQGNSAISHCNIENNWGGYACYVREVNNQIYNCLIRNNQGTSINGSVITPFYMSNSVVCGSIDGTYVGSNNLTDCGGTESGPPGACCTDTGCVDVDHQYHCVLIGGTFVGPYTDCETTECNTDDALGACCVAGNCAFTLESVCTDLAGEWQGAFVTCQTTSCTPPPPFGACCYEGNCAELTEEVCLDLLGDWRGADTACAEEDCSIPPATGACCVASGCVEVTMAECFAAPGIYAGDETACDGTECPGTCYGDVNEDGSVNVNDLLIVIAAWGPCP